MNTENYGLPAEKQKELTSGLNVVKSERELLIEEFNEVSKLEITEDNLPRFRELRLKIRDNRTKGINKWHKATKEFFLTGGKFVDAIKNKENNINEQMESKLMDAEKYFENLEKVRLEKLQSERVRLLSEFVEDASERDLSSMEQDVWESYFETKKQAHVNKIKAELEAEIERQARIKAEKEEQERIRIENARLKEEAEERERLIKIEAEKREKELEAERKKQAEILAKERLEAKRLADEEAKKQALILENQRKEAERLAKIESEKQAEIQAKKDAELKKEREEKEKLEAEIKAKKDAEIKAENEQKEAERLSKLEAEKLAKAPIKEQLSKWVESFELPEINSDNNTATDIKKKFEAFKNWSLNQIKTL